MSRRSRGLLPSDKSPLAPVVRVVGASALAIGLFVLVLSIVVIVTST